MTRSFTAYHRDRRIWMRARLLEALAAVYGVTCCRCARFVDITLAGQQPDSPSTDHLIALADGGPDDFANLRLAHLRCNREHGTRLARAATFGLAAGGRRRWGPGAGQASLW